MEEPKGLIRSKESNIRSFVRFTNCSERNIEVHWIDYRGQNIHYKNLNPTESCVINTFVTHPWLFICPKTGERLCVSNSEIFYPNPWFKFIVNASNGEVSVNRESAMIHIKLKSLREICLWRMNFLIRSKSCIDKLQIPRSLKADLLHVFHLSTRYEGEEVENQCSENSSD